MIKKDDEVREPAHDEVGLQGRGHRSIRGCGTLLARS